MHRIFAVLALATAGFGVWVLVGGPQPGALGRGADSVPAIGTGTTSMWAIGLLMGLVIAWVALVDWKNFPERFGDWLRLQRRRLALLLIGGACASVLLLF
jgi:hypothetical protein